MADTFYPDIWGDCVNTELDVTLGVISRLADDYTSKVPDIKKFGEVVHFPRFARIGEAEEMTVGTPLTPDTVKQIDSTATVKQVGKAVEIYDRVALGIKGNTYSEYAKQVAEAIALKLELDLVKEMDDNAVLKVPTASATNFALDELETALGLFGDKRNVNTFGGLVINSRLVKGLNAFTGFTDLNSTTTNVMMAKTNGIITDNIVGFYCGIPVYLSDVGTWDDDIKETKSYLIKRGAIGKVMKREVNAEAQRQILFKKWDVASDILYATKLMNEKGVVVLRNSAT